MIIRDADLERDALAIVNGAKDLISRTAIQEILPKDDATLIEMIGGVVSREGVEIIVAEADGRIVGGLGVFYSPYLWNPKMLLAEELFWWADRDAPFRTAWLLFCKAMERINNRGAAAFFRTPERESNGMINLYLREGFLPIETTYMRAP